MKIIKLLAIFFLFGQKLLAQDAILISEGNFVRGVIKGTNFSSVSILTDDHGLQEYAAKDIQSFIWNGQTYDSKPVVVKKKMEYRFFKLLETGKINLYSYGDKNAIEQPAPPRTRVRPNIGVGIGGGGGYGGGLGGGISIGIGGGRRSDDEVNPSTPSKVSYFIEKPGTGPMQEISLSNSNAVRTLLLQKLTNDEDLAESIKATETFDPKILVAIIKAYNTHE